MEPKLFVIPGGLSSRGKGLGNRGAEPPPPPPAPPSEPPRLGPEALGAKSGAGAVHPGLKVEVGAAVEFENEKGASFRGRIARLQKDGTVTVMTEQGGWRVAVERLRPATQVRKAGRPVLRVLPGEQG